jgi:hypothetical protein
MKAQILKALLIIIGLALIVIGISNKTKIKPKAGDIILLGENGSLKYASPEDVDKEDAKIGIIINNGDSAYFTVLGRVVKVNTVNLKPLK